MSHLIQKEAGVLKFATTACYLDTTILYNTSHCAVSADQAVTNSLLFDAY